MTAAISNSVAEKAVCWCEGRKKRRSLVMGRAFTPATPGCFASARDANFPQSLPEAFLHGGVLSRESERDGSSIETAAEGIAPSAAIRSEEHSSELQSH